MPCPPLWNKYTDIPERNGAEPEGTRTLLSIPRDGRIVLNSSWCRTPSMRSALPVELLDLTFQDLEQAELLPLLRVNSAFYTIAVRRLYRNISGLRPRNCVTCLQKISRNPILPPLVKSLDLSLSTSSPTGNLYRLIHTVLKSTASLTSLSIELPKSHSPVWIFDDCTFKLSQLTTSMKCTRPLAHFLDSQPSITDLTLRGFPNDGASILPFIFASEYSSLDHEEDKFELLSTSLPQLELFSAIHAGPSIIAAVVQGRPIRAVSVPLLPSASVEALDALQGSSRPLQRLSIISFDRDAPQFLFLEVSRRFPQLQALHIVVLLTQYSQEILEGWSPLLSKFKALRYITFMASTSELNPASVDEGRIAQQWHKSCPTLQTIILPRGRVWFQGDDHWDCIQD